MEQREQKRRHFEEFDSIYRRYGERFRFPVYLGRDLLEAPIEELELSVRSYNCLKRAGMGTVGDIVNTIERRTDLLRIRNLGMKSADEIMKAIMEFQFSLLSKEGQARYLRRIAEMNEGEGRRKSTK